MTEPKSVVLPLHHRGMFGLEKGSGLKEGSGTNCAQHPLGRSSNWCLTPFPTPQPNTIEAGGILVYAPDIDKVDTLSVGLRDWFVGRTVGPAGRRCAGAIGWVPLVLPVSPHFARTRAGNPSARTLARCRCDIPDSDSGQGWGE